VYRDLPIRRYSDRVSHNITLGERNSCLSCIQPFNKDDIVSMRMYFEHTEASVWLSSSPKCVCMQIYFEHKDTSVWLSSSRNKYSRPIDGHREVIGAGSRDSMSMWLASLGVYFPPREQSEQELNQQSTKEEL
jgi:hypothetical protein